MSSLEQFKDRTVNESHFVNVDDTYKRGREEKKGEMGKNPTYMHTERRFK